MTEFFVIRHKNGELMKERKTGRGYTWEDFSPSKTKNKPRLLFSEDSAKRAVRNWVQGEMYRDANGNVTVIPKPDRKPHDLTIERIVL